MDLFTEFIAFLICGSVVLFSIVIYGIFHLQTSKNEGGVEEGIESPIPAVDTTSLHEEAKKSYEEVQQRFTTNSGIFAITAAAIPAVGGATLTTKTVADQNDDFITLQPLDSFENDESFSDDVEEYINEIDEMDDVREEDYEEESFYNLHIDVENDDFTTNHYNELVDEEPYENPINNFDHEEDYTSYPSYEDDYDYDRNPYDYPGESVEIDENYHDLI